MTARSGGTAAHVIDSGSCKAGEELERCQRERDGGRGTLWSRRDDQISMVRCLGSRNKKGVRIWIGNGMAGANLQSEWQYGSLSGMSIPLYGQVKPLNIKRRE